MSDIADYFRDVKRDRQRRGDQNRTRASADAITAATLAEDSGMTLTAHTAAHYQLRRGDAMWNLYPGNQRIYVDAAHRKKTPFLRLPRSPWTLLDVVRAAVDTLKLRAE